MSTASTVPDAGTQPETMEQKILDAANLAAQAVSIFAPAAGVAVKAGVAVEPIVSGLVQMFIGIFKHHAKVAQSAAASGNSGVASVPQKG